MIRYSLCLIVLTGLGRPLLAQPVACPYQAAISPQEPGAICEGYPVLLQASPAEADSYQWLKDGLPIADATTASLEVAVTGAYRVIVTRQGCADTATAVAVVEDSGDKPNPPAITAPASVCAGEAVQLSTPAIANATYYWTGPEGYASHEQQPLIAQAGPAQAGTYRLEVRLGKCYSEIATHTLQVTAPPVPIISGDSLLCPQDSLRLQVTHPAATRYQWQWDGRLLAGATGADLYARLPGSYQVTAYDARDCASTSEPFAVTSFTADAAFTVHEQVCTDELVQFVPATPTDTSAALVHFWDFGDGQTADEPSPLHTYTAPGQRVIKHTISSTSGDCVAEAMSTIEVIALPQITLQPSVATLCQGDTLSVRAEGTFHSLRWDDGDTLRLRQLTRAGVYPVTAYNALGCSVSAALTVTAGQPPSPTIVADREQITAGDTVVLTASGADHYEWYVAAQGLGSQSTLAVAPTATTTYALVGHSTEGCSATSRITIQVDPPNLDSNALRLFSPNQDGIDDYWQPAGVEQFTACSLKIFNVQGSLIYQSNRFDERGWNGTDQQGAALPEGVYYFTLQCSGADRQSGSITLLR